MPSPPITLIAVGDAAWITALQASLPDDMRLLQMQTPGSYMNTLVEELVALVLVDGQLADWDRWTSTPKSSPATRRIPIVLISEDREQQAESALQGADMALSAQELLKNPGKSLRDMARIPDADRLAQLDCECEEPLPKLAREGIARFNAGEYYAQHDLFEEQWMATEGPVRDLYRAILQVGVAYYQIERGNYRGALKMLQRSVQWLLILPDRCQGVDVARLREDSFRVRAALQALGEARFAEFDHSLIRGVIWQDHPPT